VFLIAAAVTAMAAAIVALQTLSADGAADASLALSGSIEGAAAPIASEAGVYRMVPGLLARESAARRAAAHPRTLTTFRGLREFPGAPPRVPHGLTPAEFRDATCNTCHERGGYSQRFGAYAPVTPHPELRACLQCHPTDEALVGVPLARPERDIVCRQCHSSDGARPREPEIEWRRSVWPAAGLATAAGVPPTIPHDVSFRTFCVACHAGPGAVVEIRTKHPERSNCLQCHARSAEASGFILRDSVYVRPAPTPAGRGEAK
jgi:cytochrome c-type protein NapB